MTVAAAAPTMPQRSTHTHSQSRKLLASRPSTITAMAPTGRPLPRSRGSSPEENSCTAPSKITTRRYSSARGSSSPAAPIQGSSTG